MKKLRYILFAMSLTMATTMLAQELAGSQIQKNNKAVSLSADAQLLVGMDVTVPADLEISSSSMLTLTPILVEKGENGANKTLPAIFVYGRNRQLLAERSNKIPADAFEVVRRDNGTAQTVHYTARVPYEKWMNGADLKMMGIISGCANCLKDEDLAQVYPVLLEPYKVQPLIAFVKPEAEVKQRAEKGNAYLDFPVNQTKIYPEYRRNPMELAEINRTINVVKENTDTKITSISLHGYASPEGSYANNTRLAKGRSEALKTYIMKEYGLSADMFTVQSTPEDWAGLRAYVEKNNVANKAKVLEIIDSQMDNLDAKENKIKALDGAMYQALLRDCYPALRHTDYVVHYTVRAYSVDEAKALLKSRPQLLSLEEMYLVAQTYQEGSDEFNIEYFIELIATFLVCLCNQEGSDEFNEVFDIAVRMYPEDSTANINAAAMELKRGNTEQAVRYLQRSNQTNATAQNNQGVYHMLTGDLDKAEACFKKAKELGSAQADGNLEEVRKKREDNAAFGE